MSMGHRMTFLMRKTVFHFSQFPFPCKSWRSEIPGYISSVAGDRPSNITQPFTENSLDLGQLGIFKLLLCSLREDAI